MEERRISQYPGETMFGSSPRESNGRCRLKGRQKSFSDRNIMSRNLDITSENLGAKKISTAHFNDLGSKDEDFIILRHNKHSDRREKLDTWDTFDNEEIVFFDDDKSGGTWGNEAEVSIPIFAHYRKFSNRSLSVYITSQESYISGSSFNTTPRYHKNLHSQERKVGPNLSKYSKKLSFDDNKASGNIDGRIDRMRNNDSSNRHRLKTKATIDEYTYQKREKDRNNFRNRTKRTENKSFSHVVSHLGKYYKDDIIKNRKPSSTTEHYGGSENTKNHNDKRENSTSTSKVIKYNHQKVLDIKSKTKQNPLKHSARDVVKRNISSSNKHYGEQYIDKECSTTMEYGMDINSRKNENKTNHRQPKEYIDGYPKIIQYVNKNNSRTHEFMDDDDSTTSKIKIPDQELTELAKTKAVSSGADNNKDPEEDDDLMEAEVFYQILKDCTLNSENAEIILKELNQALELPCFETDNLNRLLFFTDERKSENMDVLIYFRDFICKIARIQLILKKPAIALRYILNTKNLISLKKKTIEKQNNEFAVWIEDFARELEDIGSEALEACNCVQKSSETKCDSHA